MRGPARAWRYPEIPGVLLDISGWVCDKGEKGGGRGGGGKRERPNDWPLSRIKGKRGGGDYL